MRGTVDRHSSAWKKIEKKLFKPSVTESPMHSLQAKSGSRARVNAGSMIYICFRKQAYRDFFDIWIWLLKMTIQNTNTKFFFNKNLMS